MIDCKKSEKQQKKSFHKNSIAYLQRGCKPKHHLISEVVLGLSGSLYTDTMVSSRPRLTVLSGHLLSMYFIMHTAYTAHLVTVYSWMYMWLCKYWADGKIENWRKEGGKEKQRLSRRMCRFCTNLGEVIAVRSKITFICQLPKSGERGMCSYFLLPSFSLTDLWIDSFTYILCTRYEVINISSGIAWFPWQQLQDKWLFIAKFNCFDY